MDRPLFFNVYCILVALYISFSNADPADISANHEDGADGKNIVVGSSQDEICLTKGCVKVAAKLMENMDEEVDPCDDFYQFSCGGFINNAIIPPDMSDIWEGSILEDKLYLKKKRMFEGKSDQTEPKIFQSLRNLYKSCMDIEDVEKNSVNDLKNALKEVGGFPVVEGDKWNEKSYSSYEVALKLVSLGLPAVIFVDIDFDIDAKNTTTWLLSINEGSAALSRESLLMGLNDSKVEAYLNSLIETAKFLGASAEAAKTEMNDVLNFMIEISKIQKPQEYWRKVTASYNLMTLKEVSIIYPNVPWVDLFNRYLDLYNGTNEVNENDTVVVDNPSYLKNIQDLLANTSSRVQANFQISQAIPMSYLTEEALKITYEYNKQANGHEGRKPRWKYCVQNVGLLTIASNSMFVRKYFSNKSKKKVSDIVQNILDEFNTTLDELDWMDQKTKENAHEKVDLMKFNVGYPEELLNNSLVDEYYEGLHISPTGFFNNVCNIGRYFSKKEKAKYTKPVKKNDWTENAEMDVVNAHYNQADNTMTLTAAILSGIFFDPDFPPYMNYGATGKTAGHELLHGFDDEGSQRDGYGNLVDWWSPDTKKTYLQKTRCVIEAYGNYTIMVEGEEFHLNGVNTQGENIADIEGVRQAYRAYQRVSENLKEHEGLLPGLPYTQNQLFWIAGALTYCAAERPEYLKDTILVDPHTPAKFRVNGRLFHLEEFSKDWNCPIGSKMNPEEKCHVW